ncbi:hypothetical protein KA977_15125, partial [Candidatus Dependentiae bacterium]|nr:hypothetical protein [Candidatus Dependentiae bacterium]
MGNSGNNNLNTGLIFFFISIICLTFQTVLFRELLSLFNGSEYIISFYWFIWFSANIAGCISGLKFRFSEKKFVYLCFIYLLVCIASLIFIKYSGIFFVSGNTEINIIKCLIIVVISIIIPCFINSFIFCCLLNSNEKTHTVTSLYIKETAGFIIAGLLTYFSVNYIIDFYLFSFLGVVINFLLIIYIYLNSKKISLTGILCFFISVFFIFSYNDFSNYLIRKIYPGFFLSEEINDEYGKHILISSENEKCLMISGTPVLFQFEPGIDEEIIFSGTVQTKEKPVLLIDGILFFPLMDKLKSVNTEEINVVFPSEKLYFSALKTIDNSSELLLSQLKNVKIHFGSLQNYLTKSKKKFDFIIIDIKNTALLQNAFYYYPETYALIKSKLTETGIVSFLFPGESNYISRESELLKKSVISGMKKVFFDVNIFPLTYTIIMAGNNKIISDFEKMDKILDSKKIIKKYFNFVNIGLRLSNFSKINEYFVSGNYEYNTYRESTLGAISNTQGTVGTDFTITSIAGNYFLDKSQ